MFKEKARMESQESVELLKDIRNELKSVNQRLDWLKSMGSE